MYLWNVLTFIFLMKYGFRNLWPLSMHVRGTLLDRIKVFSLSCIKQYLRVVRIERPELRDEDGQVVLYHRVGVHYQLEKETIKEKICFKFGLIKCESKSDPCKCFGYNAN